MMTIERNKNYCIDLYSEPNKKADHKRSPSGILTFTGADLFKAIVSVGMPDVYLKKKEKIKRTEEIEFKVKLFETFVASSLEGKLTFDTLRKKYLDSTEVAAINYWIGMVLTTVLGQKKYHYDFMIHLSMIYLFCSKINITNHKLVSLNGKSARKSPDLIAVNISKDTLSCLRQ